VSKVVITVGPAQPGTSCEWCNCSDEHKATVGYKGCVRCTSRADHEIYDEDADFAFYVCDYHQADCLRFIRKVRTGGFARQS
jgi:hypothetical protein